MASPLEPAVETAAVHDLVLGLLCALRESSFTREGVIQSLIEEMRRSEAGAANENTLRRDVEVFVRCYVPARASRGGVVEDSLDCPLAELNLIEENEGGVYRIRRGPKPGLSDHIFAYALADFGNARRPTASPWLLAKSLTLPAVRAMVSSWMKTA